MMRKLKPETVLLNSLTKFECYFMAPRGEIFTLMKYEELPELSGVPGALSKGCVMLLCISSLL